MKTMETSSLIANDTLIQLAKDVIRYADDVAWQNKQILSDVLLAAVWCCLNSKLPMPNEDIESSPQDAATILDNTSDEEHCHERDKLSEIKTNEAQTSLVGNQQCPPNITDMPVSYDEEVSKSDLLCSIGLSVSVSKENPRDNVCKEVSDSEKDNKTAANTVEAGKTNAETEYLDSAEAAVDVDHENFKLGESEVINIDDDDDDHGDDVAALEDSKDDIALEDNKDDINMQNGMEVELNSAGNKVFSAEEQDYFDMSCEEIDEEGVVDVQTSEDMSVSAVGLESTKKKPQQCVKTEKVSDEDVILIGSDDDGDDKSMVEASKQNKAIDSCVKVEDIANDGEGISKDSDKTKVYPVSDPKPVNQGESRPDLCDVYLGEMNLRHSEDDGSSCGNGISEISQGTSVSGPFTSDVQSDSNVVMTSYDSLHTEAEVFGGCKELYPADVTEELDQKPLLMSFSGEEQNHSTEMEKEVEHRCTICDKKYQSPSALSRHIKSHSTAKYKCPVCSKEYHIKYDFDRHVDSHNGDKHNLCDECGKSFCSKIYLKKHQQVVHGKEYKFVCHLCGMRFSYKAGLAAHTARHKGEKLFECAKCHRTFLYSCNAKRHQLQNTCEKMTKSSKQSSKSTCTCVTCSKTFPTQKGLKQHMFLHKEPSFVCSLCGQAFVWKSSFRSHTKTCHL